MTAPKPPADSVRAQNERRDVSVTSARKTERRAKHDSHLERRRGRLMISRIPVIYG
jgi:hypothetical protein